MAAKKQAKPKTVAKRKPAAKKSAAGKSATGKAATRKPAAKKTAGKKLAAKKAAGKKPAANKAAPKKAARKGTSAKKSAKAGRPTRISKAVKAAKPTRPTKAAKTPKPAKTTKPAAAPKVAKAAKAAKPTKVNNSARMRKVTVAPRSGAGGANGAKLTGFVAKQRQRLLDLRDELINSMYGVTRDTLRNAPEGSEASGSGMHQGDAGSDAYDRDFALSVLAKEQDALYEIEEALKRIQRGTYGICEISGRKIPQARLEAMPFARLTVECQAEWEREHGQRRFRPSADVGFGGGQILDEDDESAVSLDEDDE